MPGRAGAVKDGDTSVELSPVRTAVVPSGAFPTMGAPGVRVVNLTAPDAPRSGANAAIMASVMYAAFVACGLRIEVAICSVADGGGGGPFFKPASARSRLS